MNLRWCPSVRRLLLALVDITGAIGIWDLSKERPPTPPLPPETSTGMGGSSWESLGSPDFVLLLVDRGSTMVARSVRRSNGCILHSHGSPAWAWQACHTSAGAVPQGFGVASSS